MAFLRDTVPERAGNRDDRELYRDVVRYEASGRSIGLTTERAFGKWAHLMAMTKDEIGRRDGPVHADLTVPPGWADDKLEKLIAAMTAEARRMERSV